jgi:DNA transformation protein
MKDVDNFTHHTLDVLHAFGPVNVRRMFAGYGLFRDGLMFALIYDGILYLKVDDENIGDFINHGLPQFEYRRQGKRVGLSYYQAPESVMEDSDEAAEWAGRSWEAARRASAGKCSKGRALAGGGRKG